MIKSNDFWRWYIVWDIVVDFNFLVSLMFVASLKELLNKYLNFQLTDIQKQALKNFFDVKYTYNSNAIEWTTFSEKETALVLKWNVITWHSLKEHFEVVNHKKAFDFVCRLTDCLDKSHKSWLEIFNEDNVLNIHKILLQNINDQYAWVYRDVNVRIAYSRAVLPRYEKVPTLMMNFFEEFTSRYKEIDLDNIDEVLKYWFDLHIYFVKIHPFIDWNGRTARLLMNMWFLYVFNVIDVIYFDKRKEYMDSIENFEENPKGYYDFMEKNFERFLKEVIDLLENNIYFKI